MMEGSESVQNNNGSGSRRTKNILILRIRIRNTDADIDKHPSNARKLSANSYALAIDGHMVARLCDK